jgi:putative tryptophan/tyrosine transport system substrate-binding protein
LLEAGFSLLSLSGNDTVSKTFGGYMQRREFIAGLGGAAAAWPLAARAQQPAMPVIGYLGSASAEQGADRLRAFRQGLSEAGYVEGQNVAIEFRWADGHYDRLGALVDDLVRRQVAVIVTPGSAPAALAAKAATKTIPIVFETGADPVAVGLVESLSRPGGNVTGAAAIGFELGPKRLELLHELVPAAKTVALIVNPANLNTEALNNSMQSAASALGLQLHVLRASAESEIDLVFAQLVQVRAGGLLTSPDPFLNSRSEQLVNLTIRHAVPANFHLRAFAVAGGLMSYGTPIAETHRLAGLYTGRILKGEKPADLPVQQSTKVELIINMRTAKVLGLTVPPSMLARADEVIE